MKYYDTPRSGVKTKRFCETANFEVLAKIEESFIDFDRINKVARVCWRGVVNEEVCEKLMVLGADLIEFRGFDRIILDRTNLEEFTYQSRVWLRAFFKDRAKRLSLNLRKVSVVSAKSTFGLISGEISFRQGIKFFIKVPAKKFDSLGESLKWINEE